MSTSAARQRTVNDSPLPTPVRERRPLSFCARPCSRSPSSGPSRSLPSSLHGSVASSLKMSSSPSSVRFGEVEKLSVLPSRLCVSSSSREMQTHRSRQGLFPPAVQTGGASPAASQDAVSSLCLSSSLSSAVASPVSPTFENASGDSFSSLGFSGPLSPLHSPAEEETTAALPAVAVREESCFSEEAKKFSERRESTRVQEQQQEQRDTRAEETTGDREGEGDVVVQERETEHLSEAEVHPFPRNSSDTALFLSSSLDSEKTGDSSASPREALLRRLQGHLRFLSSFSTTQQLPPCSALWNAKTKHAERRTSSTTRMNSSERTSKDSSKLQTRQSTPEYAQTKKTHLRQPSARSTTSRHPSLPSSHPSSSSLPSSHPSSSSRQSTSLPSSRRSRPSSVKRSPGGQSTLRDRGSAACPPQRSVKASSLRCPCISPRRRLQMSAASKKLRGEEEWRREAGTERNMEETKRDTGERKPLTGREEGREGQDVREGKNGTERGESGVDTALKGLAEKEEANKVGGTKSSVLDELESEIEKGVFKADLVIAATTEEQGEEGAEQKDGCFKDTEEARAQSSTASSLARQQKKTQPAQRREEEREREGEKEREGRAAASTGKGRWSVSGGGMDGPREATKLTMEQEKNAKLLEDLCVKFTAHKLLQMRRSRAVAFSREGSEGENRPADLLSRAARTSRGDMRSTTNEEKERGDKENGTSGVTEEAQEDEEVKGRFTETCSSIRLHPSSTSQQPRKTRGSVACSLSSSRSCSLSRSVRSAGSFSDQQTELPTLLSRICGPSLKKADAARKANTKTGQSAKRYEEESAQTAEERLPGQGVGTICPSSVRSTKRIDETPFSASPTSRVSLPASEKSDCRLPSSPYSPEKRPLSSRSRRRHVILLTPLPSSSPLASPFLSASTSSSAFPSSSSSAFPSSSSSSAFPSSSSSALPSSSSSAFPSSSSAFPSSSSSAFPSSSSSAFPSSSSSAFPSSSSSAFPSSSSSAFPSSTRRATRRECTDARRSFRRGEGEADFEKMRETSAARRERREDGARLTDLRGKEGAFTASQDKNRTRKSREPSANAGAASHLHGEQSSRLLHCPKTLQPRSSSSSPRDGTPSLHKGKTEGFVSPRTRPCSSLPLHSHLPVASCSRCSSQPFQPSCLPVYSASPSPLPSFVHLSSLLYAPPPSSHLPASSPQLSSALPSSSSRPSSLPFFPQAFAPAGCTPVFLGSSERPVSRPLASSLCRPAERGSASHDREAKESRRFLHLAEAEKESSRLRPPERAEEARGQGRFEQSGRWEASCPSLSLQRRGRRKETPRGREETTQLMLRVLDSREEGLRLRTQQEFDRLPRIHAAASPEQRRRRELGERGREVEAADPPPRRNISEQFTKQERRTRQVNLQERAGTETLERRRVNKGETTPTPFSDFSAPPELWDVALRVSPPSFPSSPFFSLSFPSSPFFSFPSLRSCGKVLQTARGQAGSCESLRSLSAADGVENEQESREKTGDM